jgi:hypothetical protein
MPRNIRKMKAYDQRTGRLERAIDLVEDGNRPGVKTTRREADRFHPQRTPIRVSPDRIAARALVGDEFRYVYGYTLGGNLWEQRSLPIVSWSIGGVSFSASAHIPGLRFVLEDVSGQFLTEDGVSAFVTE